MKDEIFLARNSDAELHLDKIDEIVNKSKGNISRKDAWDIIKGSIPKESVSKTDFTTKSQPVNSKKKLSDLSMEEAIKLDKASYAKWAESQ